ncbi:MAG: mechanosensitive ion channel [Nostocoides sp.]
MNFDSIDWQHILLNVVYAVVILIVTWFLAGLVKRLLGKYLNRVGVLRRTNDNGDTLATSLASIGSLLVWLFGLIAVLNLFGLTEVLGPVQGMLNEVLGYLPNVIGAALIFFFGLVLAKIVRELIVAALEAVNLDRYVTMAGRRAEAEIAAGVADTQPAAHSAPANSTSITKVIGQIVFAVVLIVVSIAALQVLGIASISEPATQMLELILAAIPAIIGAAILLGIGVLVARFAGGLVESMLRSTGFDATLARIGIEPKDRDAASVVNILVQIAIILFFAVAGTRLLGFPEITAMLDAVLLLAGRVLFGGVVIAAGVYIASLLAKMVGNGTGALIVRWATIVLFVAMGLKFMGLADSIVNLAFGALVVGAATAAALAFGLGGREAASRELQRFQQRRAA